MRKAMLMLGLAMLGVMLLGSVAQAQPNGPAYDFIEVPNNIRPCPFGLERVQQDYQREVVCGEGGGYVFAPGGSASPSPSPEPSASPTASPTASPSASPSADDSQYSAPSLPATGGASPLVPLGALALLAGGGLLAVRSVRR